MLAAREGQAPNQATLAQTLGLDRTVMTYQLDAASRSIVPTAVGIHSYNFFMSLFIAPWTERVLFKTFARLLVHPTLYRLGARIGRILQRPLIREGRIRALPFFFGRWTKTRDLPPVAARTFQERWPEL